MNGCIPKERISDIPLMCSVLGSAQWRVAHLMFLNYYTLAQGGSEADFVTCAH